MGQAHTSKRFLMSFIRGKKPHRAKTIIPIAGTTNAVAGFASKVSHDLSKEQKEEKRQL
jgi:predicted metal-dependent RNase